MSDGVSGLVNRIIRWADRLQRRHGVLGFPYTVVKKYGDDERAGGRAALITCYGFLSIFPLPLLGVAVLSRVLALLAREQERIPAARVESHLAAQGSPPAPGGFPASRRWSRLTRPSQPPAGQRHCRNACLALVRWSYGSPLGPGPAVGGRVSAGAWWAGAAWPARRSVAWRASRITPPTVIPIPAPARTSRG